MRLAKNARSYISILVAITILLPHLPHFAPEDMSRDGNVDLRDAILLVKHFEDSVATSKTSLKGLDSLINTFHVTSGLTQVIRKGERETISFRDAPCAVSSVSAIFQYHLAFPKPIGRSDDFSSFYTRPNVPPPRFILS